ncbi:MAG: aminotransferase class V-fold PLP-dependent enzyme [Candidatus Eisenbacteria bacterium]
MAITKNIGPWVDLERFGVVVRTWAIDTDSWTLRADDLEPLLSPRTKLVAFTHASNLVGTIHPVREIVERVHAAGARVCVDGVACAPHRQLAVRDWGRRCLRVQPVQGGLRPTLRRAA